VGRLRTLELFPNVLEPDFGFFFHELAHEILALWKVCSRRSTSETEGSEDSEELRDENISQAQTLAT
jgi:hypothetical protein